LGGICWATAIGLLAYFLGNAAGNAIEAFGLYGIGAVLVAIGVFLVAHFRHRRRANAGTTEVEPSQDTTGERQSR
jgi:membrane protein DedA with SNARE-associated domain